MLSRWTETKGEGGGDTGGQLRDRRTQKKDKSRCAKVWRGVGVAGKHGTILFLAEAPGYFRRLCLFTLSLLRGEQLPSQVPALLKVNKLARKRRRYKTGHNIAVAEEASLAFARQKRKAMSERN